MNTLKIIFAVMLIFDVTYMFIYFGWELCTTIRYKLRKEKKAEAKTVLDEYTFDDDDEFEEDYSYAPPLCIDSIHLLHRYDVKTLITARIFPLSKEITDQLSNEDKEQVIRLLSAFINFLHDEAPKYEQNFTVVMELLKAASETYDPEYRDPVDKLLDDCISRNRQTPDYYLDYQNYRITCKNKAHILAVCKVLILTALKKLYGEWYSSSYELYNPESVQKLLRDAQRNCDIEMEDM